MNLIFCFIIGFIGGFFFSTAISVSEKTQDGFKKQEEEKHGKEKAPHWISVEERLPEFGERVLVSNGGFVCESFLSQSGRWQRGGVDMFFMTPTHWCEMPEPPKEENKQ